MMRVIYQIHNSFDGKNLMSMAIQMSLLMNKLSNRMDEEENKGQTEGIPDPFPPGTCALFSGDTGDG